jgi:hypothetical protein
MMMMMEGGSITLPASSIALKIAKAQHARYFPKPQVAINEHRNDEGPDSAHRRRLRGLKMPA